MKNGFFVKKQIIELPKLSTFKDNCKQKLFIPTHGNDGKQYLFLIDFNEKHVIQWHVDMTEWIDYLHKMFIHNAVLPAGSPKTAIYSRLVLHAAINWNNYIYVFPISGNFILKLDCYSEEFEIICKDPFKILCPTNNIHASVLYYTQWDIRDTIKRVTSEDNVPLDFCSLDLNNGVQKIYKTTLAPDTIHQTYYNYNRNCIIAVEMPRFFKLPLTTEDSVEHRRNVVKAGVSTAKLLVYHIDSDNLLKFNIENGPAHFTQDFRDDSIFYFVCCNLSSAYCFGSGSIMKMKITDKIQLSAVYKDDDLFRIPSLNCFSYKDSNLLCCAVFHNQVHIINSDTMKIQKKIQLAPIQYHPDFSNGPYLYPNFDKTPYTVSPIENSPFLLLSSIWSVQLYDYAKDKIIARVNYNTNRCPLVTTGHSIFLKN